MPLLPPFRATELHAVNQSFKTLVASKTLGELIAMREDRQQEIDRLAGPNEWHDHRLNAEPYAAATAPLNRDVAMTRLGRLRAENEYLTASLEPQAKREERAGGAQT
jgi:hypothetical protein